MAHRFKRLTGTDDAPIAVNMDHVVYIQHAKPTAGSDRTVIHFVRGGAVWAVSVKETPDQIHRTLWLREEP
jgi:hypothetical protein